MNKLVNRNWLYESEVDALASRTRDASHALSEAFDRSDRMWEEEHLPDDPTVMIDIADAARDLAAKALIIMGVQEGGGPNARIVKFASAHEEEAIAALREGRPLSAEAVNAAHREFSAFEREQHDRLLALMGQARDMEVPSEEAGFRM
jgi:hypothetical protein